MIKVKEVLKDISKCFQIPVIEFTEKEVQYIIKENGEDIKEMKKRFQEKYVEEYKERKENNLKIETLTISGIEKLTDDLRAVINSKELRNELYGDK